MKFLFLDIDGVLCTMRSHWAADPDAGGMMVALDQVAVQLINRICEKTGAQVVLSTSWREVYGVYETFCHLRASGLHRAHIPKNTRLHATPSNKGLSSRGNEVKEFLEKPQWKGYCILDDNTDFLEDQKPFFVHTDPVNGLMWQHAKRAVEILGGEIT